MLTFKSFTRQFAVKLWPWYLGGILALAVTNLITLEIPQLAKEVVNHFEAGTIDYDLRWIALMIIGLGFTQMLVRSLSRCLIFWPGRNIEADSKIYFFERVMQLPQRFFDQHGLGDLISRLSNDITQLRVFYAFAVLQVANLTFIFVFTISKMLSVHVTLTLLCLLPILLMGALTRYILPMIHQFSRQNLDALGRLTSKVTESFVNIHIIQQSGAEPAFLERINKENEEVYATNMKMVTVRTLFFSLLSSLASLAQIAVLLYGGQQIIAGHLTVGDILAFNLYLGYLAFPFMSLGMVISIYKRAKTALERVAIFEESHPEKAIGDGAPKIGDGASAPSPYPLAPSPRSSVPYPPLLHIKDLSYVFPGGKVPVLNHVNLSITAGEKVGIYGSVGSGKSVLFALITRIYDPEPGTIFFKGKDVLAYDPFELRNEIGLVLQLPHLFSASVKENISFGMEDVPFEKIKEAAEAAQLLGEIERFHDQWEAKIGERGLRLSGGQKQRLSLARILLRQPTLWLLDDVMSAVDHHTERQLIKVLFKQDATAMISSHRISVLERCDRVVSLEKGILTPLIDLASIPKGMSPTAEASW
jgi:ATP-binding cassette subfamily B protein